MSDYGLQKRHERTLALLELALATIAYIAEKGEHHWNAPVTNDVPPILHSMLPKVAVYDPTLTAAECLAAFDRLGPECAS